MKSFIVVSVLLLISLQGRADQFYNINAIVQTLNPLDIITNYDGIRYSIDLDIQFALNSADLLPAAQRQIQALAGAIDSERLAAYRFRIIGHTDAQGDTAYNQRLSFGRANAVCDALIGDYGVSSERLQCIGKGETALMSKLAPHDSRHRRVEIVTVPINNLKRM